MGTDRSSAGALPAALQLLPVSSRSRMWLVGLTAVLPMLICALAGGMLLQTAAPERVDAGVALALLSAVLVAGVLSTLLLARFKRHEIAFDNAGIEVSTTFYRRRVSFSDLDLAAARVVDLAEHTELRPLIKTNAVAVPGFRSGWFRLRNWQRALVAVSDGPRVLWLPTRLKFGLLLQPQQPQATLDRIRELAGKPNAR